MSARSADRGGIFELPTVSGPGAGRGLDGQYIYGAAGHLRGLVATHGAHPLAIVDSLTRAGLELPSRQARSTLAGFGVTRVVVHRRLGDALANACLIRSFKEAGYRVLFDGPESAVFDISHVN